MYIALTTEQLSTLCSFCQNRLGLDPFELTWGLFSGTYRSGVIEEPAERHWTSRFIGSYEVVVCYIESNSRRRLPVRAQIEIWLSSERIGSISSWGAWEVIVWYDSKNREWILQDQADVISDDV